jgi:hypothetical protein
MFVNRLRSLTAALCASFALAFALTAQGGEPGSGARAFAQLGEALPTANSYRTASGAPGHAYWQQQADYQIEASLDEKNRRLSAAATITYHNNSPDTLRYLWLQLDQNRFRADSLDRRSRTQSEDRVSYGDLRDHQSLSDTPYGYSQLTFHDSKGKPLPFTVVDTLVRIDLPTALTPDTTFAFTIEWAFNIIEEAAVGGRGGYEYFPETTTQLFFLAQWFPRLVAYSDYDGWHNKAFLGRGEFTLEFGDYDVKLDVPNNHIVSATGELTNPQSVLTPRQRERLASAGSDEPRFIVTPDEAIANQQTQADGRKVWHFKANKVRDFAWASSSKFIWDAMIHKQPGAQYDEVLAMSFYPPEAEPIWSRYSTHAVVHTMEVYSRFSFDYPYPTAQSVNTWERGGMEYPMITFNGYRPDPPRAKEDPEAAESLANGQRAYSRQIKYGLIGVIIHEIGHIYFPMVVNSDERQWTWMDEGLNTFLEYVSELEWEEDYPAFRNETNLLDYIPSYMTSPNQVPVMTQSDSILQFGPNAYAKPAAALTVLRETVMGRELFDFAFREYANRWKFKRPTPADFFRTMEDASGVDLDWFWRAWFYTTDHVDVGIADIRAYRLKTNDPDSDFPLDRAEYHQNTPEPISIRRNQAAGIIPRETRYETLQDLYSDNDRFTVTNKDRNDARKDYDKLEPWEQKAFDRAIAEDALFYFIDFENVGGVPSPLLMTIHYSDGSTRDLTLPPEIWRRDAKQVTYRLIEDKVIDFIELDRHHQTADANTRNNRFPPVIKESRLAAYKSDRKTRNLMADLLHKLKAEEENGATQKTVELEALNGD